MGEQQGGGGWQQKETDEQHETVRGARPNTIPIPTYILTPPPSGPTLTPNPATPGAETYTYSTMEARPRCPRARGSESRSAARHGTVRG